MQRGSTTLCRGVGAEDGPKARDLAIQIDIRVKRPGQHACSNAISNLQARSVYIARSACSQRPLKPDLHVAFSLPITWTVTSVYALPNIRRIRVAANDPSCTIKPVCLTAQANALAALMRLRVCGELRRILSFPVRTARGAARRRSRPYRAPLDRSHAGSHRRNHDRSHG